ncbi:MAG: DUF2283 domain-containing protein [Rivularia sp. (in: cyanobacteria)]
MKITYDAEVDILIIIFSNTRIEESDRQKPEVIFDYDQNSNIVGLEIIDASEPMENPGSDKLKVKDRKLLTPNSQLLTPNS